MQKNIFFLFYFIFKEVILKDILYLKNNIVETVTFDSMQNVIKETKKAMEFQPKMKQLFNEVETFSKSHQTLEKENANLQKEVKGLTTSEIKDYYDNRDFNFDDVYDISKGATKEDELFDYVGYEKYYGKSSYNELDDTYYKDIDKDDFCL